MKKKLLLCLCFAIGLVGLTACGKSESIDSSANKAIEEGLKQ